MKKNLALVFLLFLATPLIAQQKPEDSSTPTDSVKLERVDELERENIRLIALISQLQKEISELRGQIQSTQLSTRASAFIEKMKAQGHEVNPQTLEVKPKSKK